MDGTYTLRMGDRGRLVVPAELRERAALPEGTPLILVETPSGLLLMTRAQARDHLRNQLAGADLVAELLLERRQAAVVEDAR